MPWISLQQMAQKKPVSAFHFAMIYLGLGENDRAIEMLQKAYEEHFSFLSFMNLFPPFDPIRSDPRFRELARRIGLP